MRVYDVDHLGNDYSVLWAWADSYIINLKQPWSRSNNTIRVVSKSLKQARQLENKISIFHVAVWPYKEKQWN